MLSVEQLSARLDDLLVDEGGRFLSHVPFASHLTDDAVPLHPYYYLRHRIETVWRIWLIARIDSIALTRMVAEDHDAARMWNRYLSEAVHRDHLFLADLECHGYTEADVRATIPLRATQELMAHLEASILRLGSLPAVAYSIFAEWNSGRFSSQAVDRAAVAFEKQCVVGSRSHAERISFQRRYRQVLEIALYLLDTEKSLDAFSKLIAEIAAHFRDYFCELYEVTAARAWERERSIVHAPMTCEPSGWFGGVSTRAQTAY